MPLRSLSAAEFARRLAHTQVEQEPRFAFFVGAGASVSSGIPAARTLVRDFWLPRLRDLKGSTEPDVISWATSEVKGFDAEKPEASYGRILDLLFLTPEDRQREIDRLCRNKFPGFGYATLARLMAMRNGKFSVAITTNFDDLISDALFLFTHQARPLVIEHQGMAHFIRPTSQRPLVVKLHGSHQLAPRNLDVERESLEAEIQGKVTDVLFDRGLIVLGYRGNDPSIASLLRNLPAGSLRHGVYWVSENEPAGLLSDWLAGRKAIWVQSPSFDDLMLALHRSFSLPNPTPERYAAAIRRFQASYYHLQVRGRGKAVGPERTISVAEMTSESAVLERLPDVMEQGPAAAQKYLRDARYKFPQSSLIAERYGINLSPADVPHGELEKIHRDDAERFPEDPYLRRNLAWFLAENGRISEALREMNATLDIADSAESRAWLGLFQSRFLKDDEAARRSFEAALEEEPTNGTILALAARVYSSNARDRTIVEPLIRQAESCLVYRNLYEETALIEARVRSGMGGVPVARVDALLDTFEAKVDPAAHSKALFLVMLFGSPSARRRASTWLREALRDPVPFSTAGGLAKTAASLHPASELAFLQQVEDCLTGRMDRDSVDWERLAKML